MNTLIHLFWIGFLICIAIAVFKIAIYVVILVIGLIIAGVNALIEWLK